MRECCRQGAPIRANEETCDAAPADGRTSPPSSDAAMELPAASPAIKVDACATVAADAADGGEGQGGEALVSEARQAALHEIDPPLALILMLCQRYEMPLGLTEVQTAVVEQAGQQAALAVRRATSQKAVARPLGMDEAARAAGADVPVQQNHTTQGQAARA